MIILFPILLVFSMFCTIFGAIGIMMKVQSKLQTMGIVAIVVISWVITIKQWQIFKQILDTQI